MRIGERVVGAAPPAAHDDAFGLFDDGAALHRGLHLLRQGGLGVVQVRVGEGDGGVAGEGLPEDDGVAVERSGLVA